MNEHHYQRIDKGVPRKIRKEERARARNEKGMYLTEYPAETRSQAILEAIRGLQTGSEYPEQVGQRHGIPKATIYSWLISEPQADEARSLFFSNRLGLHLDKIESAQDPLDLARGREAYRAWADIAAKRSPAHFGIKQEITHVSADLGDRLRRARERVIPGESVTLPTPEGPDQTKDRPSRT